MILQLLVGAVFAAIPSKTWVRYQGAVRGGEVREFAVLKELRRTNAKRVERLEIELGSAKSSVLEGRPSYYQVELRQNPPRLFVNLSRTINSKYQSKDLADKFRGSLYVKDSFLEFDRVTQSMRLVLDLKKKIGFKVSEGQGKGTAKILVDMADL